MNTSDKQAIFAALIDNLENQLSVSLQAARHARQHATHSESIAKSRYDTLGLEQAYLAQGQSVRAANLQLEIASLKELHTKSQLRKVNSEEAQMTSLVLLEKLVKNVHQTMYVFILPISGGITVEVANNSIQVLSVASPLGKALLGKERQEQITVNQSHYEIIHIC